MRYPAKQMAYINPFICGSFQRPDYTNPYEICFSIGFEIECLFSVFFRRKYSFLIVSGKESFSRILKLRDNNVMNTQSVPQSLRIWFVIHFVLDFLFAIPLMIAPIYSLRLFGWQTIDPIATRIVAAALFGIGFASLLGRNADVETYKEMLNLKIIWSFSAVIGILLSLLQDSQGKPPVVLALLVIFMTFNLLWVYWMFRLRISQ